MVLKIASGRIQAIASIAKEATTARWNKVTHLLDYRLMAGALQVPVAMHAKRP